MLIVAPLRLTARALKVSPDKRRDRYGRRACPLTELPSLRRAASLPDGQKPKLSKLHLLHSPFTLNRIVAHYLWEGRETQ
jgi:hypothetical protein